MKPHFKACNHGCKARQPKGQSTNGGCRFPKLDLLSKKASLLWSYHGDTEVRKFAREVKELLDHIYEE